MSLCYHYNSGLGDRFPVTNSGRMIGLLVMTAGVALFGVITGFLANAFVPPSEPERGERGGIEIDTGEMAELKRLLEGQDDVNVRILARLEKIEHLLDRDA